MTSHPHLRAPNLDDAADSADSTDAVDVVDVVDVLDADYGELLGTTRLSPLRLPPEAELAAMARRSPLLAAVRALALWIGDGRPVDDETGALGEDDLALAAEELSARGVLPTEMTDATEITEVTQVTTTRDEVSQWWELADDLEFIHIGETKATVESGVDDWPDGDDDTVLEVWKQAFASVCAWSLSLDAELAGEPHLHLHGAGATVLPLFAARENGITMAELSAMVHEVAMIDAVGDWSDEGWRSWVASHGDPAEVLYGRLALLGAVEITDGVVRLTAPGLFALWSELKSEIDIPLLPSAESMSASHMVSIALLGTDEQVGVEWNLWSATRTATDAAKQLAAAAEEGGPGERGAATALLHELGTDAHQVWERLLNVPSLRPYAKQALREAGNTSAQCELTDHDIAWLTADMFCDVDVEHPPDQIGDLLASTVGEGEEGLFEVLWRLNHPGAGAALRVFGEYHPDRKVAKAARRAAFKLESVR